MREVGIVGARGEETARVARAVENLGGVPVLIDTGRRHRWASDGLCVSYDERQIGSIRVFYVKGIPLALPLPELGAAGTFATWPERYAAERERHGLLHAALRGLELDGRLFVNSLSRFELHFLKLHQCARLVRAGVAVPQSLGTDDPEAARAFVAALGSVAVKPLSGGAMVERLSLADFTDERLGALEHAPVLLQEYIEGEELRVYVLDGEPVGAFSIPTEGVADARARLAEARLCAIDQEVSDIAVRAAQALDLVFTAVDLRRSAAGHVIVLECNPTPALGFHDKTGVVLDRLARFLVSRA